MVRMGIGNILFYTHAKKQSDKFKKKILGIWSFAIQMLHCRLWDKKYIEHKTQ